MLWLTLGACAGYIVKHFQAKWLQKFSGEERQRKQKDLYGLYDWSLHWAF
jgi:hypothetical protein